MRDQQQGCLMETRESEGAQELERDNHEDLERDDGQLATGGRGTAKHRR